MQEQYVPCDEPPALCRRNLPVPAIGGDKPPPLVESRICMAARNRRMLAWCLLTAIISPLATGCSLVPGWQGKQKRDLSPSDMPHGYPIRIVPDEQKSSKAVPVSRSSSESNDSKPPLTPAVYPPETARPLPNGEPTPTAPPDLKLPPPTPPEPPPLIVKPVAPPPVIVTAMQHFLENR